MIVDLKTRPRYVQLHETGALRERADQALQSLASCRLCPHECGIDRREGEIGVCRAGRKIRVASASPHFGEEEVLSGTKGSGTIFFSFCNLRCVFCQNCELSHEGEGHQIGEEQLADIMLRLQRLGCHNINFVSPTHYAASIISSVHIAAGKGLEIPLVYNTGGFDSIETLWLMDGIIDIYMPDLKFMDPDTAFKYTGATGYPEAAKRAIREMHRQVGDLQTDENGLAYRGLLVRHLVMPNNLANTKEAMTFLADEISPDTMVNIMGQYHPEHRAAEFHEISRRVTRNEMSQAIQIAKEAGLKRIIS